MRNRIELYGQTAIPLANPPVLPQFPYEQSARSIGRAKQLLKPTDERTLRSELVAQYLACGAGMYARQVRDPKFDNMLRLAVWGLRKARVSLPGYTKYVCTAILKRTGKFPYPAQVFGQQAIAGWLPRYTRNESGFIEVASVKLTREQLKERELEWQKRRKAYLVLLKARRDEAQRILIH